MYRFLLTPRWWAINVFVLLAVPFCLFMGSWQLSRFEDRVDAHQQQRGQAERITREQAVPLADLLPVDKQTSGRMASASGTFDPEHQYLVPDRTLDDRRGYYVLSMLRTADSGTDGSGTDGSGTDGSASGEAGSDGRALPVVRGWLPGDADPARVPPLPTGEVVVTGALQASESGGATGLPAGQLGTISAAALVNLVPYDVYDAWVTVQDVSAPLEAVPPAAAKGSGLDLKAFQNLGYTAEWFVFAGFVLFMWFRFLRRDVELARDADLGLPPDTGGPARAATPPAPSAPGTAAPAPETAEAPQP